MPRRARRTALRRPKKPRKRIPEYEEYVSLSTPPETRRKCQYKPCGKLYKPTRPHQKFCSTRCRLDDWKAHHPIVFVPKPFQ